MRRFLLNVAGLVVGTTTAICAVAVAAGPSAARIGLLGLTWLAGLVAGLVLSAPFFLNPPGSVGVWNVRAAGAVRALLLVIRSVTWFGTMLLWGFWELLFLAWDPRKRKV